MNLHVIDAGNFKLDGGAMFGVVPKSIWQRINPADENNLCSWAMRCLLVEDGNRLILIDNGMGDKQDEKFFGHYYLHGDGNLHQSLAAHGFHADDITDVFLTHLHFDHCGGSIVRQGKTLVPAFKHANYWSNEAHWKWATEPNAREKASFLPENILPIQQSGQLKFVQHEQGISFTNAISLNFYYGHTEAMMLPVISYKGSKIVFMADLLPSAGHVPLPYVMAYDTRPLETMKEKKSFLEDAVANNYVLFFEHDKQTECCTLKETERGIRAGDSFSLNDL